MPSWCAHARTHHRPGRVSFLPSFLPSIPILPTDRSNSFRCPQTKLATVPCLSNATRIVSSSLAACAPCVPLGVTCMHARVCHPWSQNDPFLFDLAVMRIKTHLPHGSHGIRQSHRRRAGDRHMTRTDLAAIRQQYFSLTPNQYQPPNSQQYFYFVTNQH